MRALWDEARKYGLVDIFSYDDGTVSCQITFHTIKHTELKARSSFKQTDVEEALRDAIKNAREIVNSLSKMAPLFALPSA